MNPIGNSLGAFTIILIDTSKKFGGVIATDTPECSHGEMRRKIMASGEYIAPPFPVWRT